MKKYYALVYICLVTYLAIGAMPAFAEDFPAKPDQTQQATRPASPNQPFYGYVPPPPIRHTWPGGYKVIFHELVDTLAEHMLGQY